MTIKRQTVTINHAWLAYKSMLLYNYLFDIIYLIKVYIAVELATF